MNPDDTTLPGGGLAAVARPDHLWGIWVVSRSRPYGFWLNHTWSGGDHADAPMAFALRESALEQLGREREETLDAGDLAEVALLGVAPAPAGLRASRDRQVLSPLRFEGGDCSRPPDPVPPAPPAQLYALWIRPGGGCEGRWLGHGEGGDDAVMCFVSLHDARATREVEAADLAADDDLQVLLVAVAPAA